MFKVGDKVRVKGPVDEFHNEMRVIYNQEATIHKGAIGIVSTIRVWNNSLDTIFVQINNSAARFEPPHLELIEEDILLDHSILVEMIKEGKISGNDLEGLKVIPTHFGVMGWYQNPWTKISTKGSREPYTIKEYLNINKGLLYIRIEDEKGLRLILDTFRIVPQDDGLIKIGAYLFTYIDTKLGCFGLIPHKTRDYHAKLEGYKVQHDIYSLTSKCNDTRTKTSTDGESGGRAAYLRSPRRCKAATGRRPIGNRACHPGSCPEVRAGKVSGSRAKTRH